MLKFEDNSKSSSLRRIREHSSRHRKLAEELDVIVRDRRLPSIEMASIPVVENWSIQVVTVPVLWGMISYNGVEQPLHQINGISSYTSQIQLLSQDNGLARCETRWYRLGAKLLD